MRRSPLKVERRFGEVCRLYLEARIIRQTKKDHEAGSKLGLFFNPDDEADMFLQDVGSV
jgi:hypothetical protein